MVSGFLFIVPPCLNTAAILCSDLTSHPRIARAFTLFLIISSSVYGVLYPPFNNALLNYTNGFFLSWYSIWSMNILFVLDFPWLRRLQVSSVQGHEFYYWEPICDTTALHRVAWAFDLSTNFRGLGWMSTSPEAPWPLAKYRWSPTKSIKFSHRLQKLLVDCLIFGGARRFVGEPSNIILLDILSIALTLYGFMDGVHVASSIVAVHILGPTILGTWGHSELYPRLFGRLSDLGYINMRSFWGRVWHDLLKGGLISITKAFASHTRKHRPHDVAIQSAICFVLSAAVHAAATYSVSRSVSDAFQVFVGFSMQVLGIMMQQAMLSVLFPANAMEKWPALQSAKKAIEAAVGIGWVLISFRVICMDPALRAAIKSANRFVPI